MTAPKVVLATRNPHKVDELREILAKAGAQVDLLGLADHPEVPEVAETGDSFVANALLKARAATTATGLPALADDSGLCVDALNGMPGIFSARWAGDRAGAKANLDLVLAQIADVPDERRGAHFECAAVLVLPDGRETVALGRVEGTLLREPRGSGGFGYDPVFRPHGENRTTAEMSAAEKHAISHRGRAFRALAPALHELLG